MKTYSASYRCNSSLLSILKETLSQLLVFRWQILLAVQTKIKVTYHQDVFGLFWSFLMPIVPMGVYMVLADIKVFNSSSEMPFVFYIAVGMTIWLLMADIMRKVMYSIKQDKSILTTTNFPVIVVMLSQLGEVIHDTLLRFLALLFISLYFKIDVSLVGVFYAFLTLIPLIFLSFALGMILSIFDVVIQDTRRVVGIVLRYGLFISSVIFPFPTDGVLGMINQFNFFNTYINAIRDFLFYGYVYDLEKLIFTILFSFILLIISIKIVYSVEYKIRAYL